jgi:hypothetical protein
MNSAEAFAFDNQGYLHRRGALSADRVAALRDRLTEIEGRPSAGIPPLCVRSRTPGLDEVRIRNLPEIDPLFVDLVDEPAWLADVDAMVPGPARLTDAYSITRRRGLGLPLHSIDIADYRVADGRPSTRHLTVMVCLSDCAQDDGPFVVIAGSHRSEVLFPWSPVHAEWQVPAGQEAAVQAALRWIEPPLPRVRWEDIPGYREVTFAAGDVVLFTEDVWHGARAVASDRVRRTLYYSYSPYHFANWHGLGRSRQLLARCSGRRRQLLDGPFVGNTFASGPPVQVPDGMVPHLQDSTVAAETPIAAQIAARLCANARPDDRGGRLRVHAGDETLIVDLAAHTAIPGDAVEPEVAACVLASRRTLQQILDGRADAVSAFYRGEVEIRGDVALAMQFAAHLLAPT